MPDTFTRMVAALKKNYGIKDDKLVFFTMHIMADQEHGDEGIEMVAKYAVTPLARKQVFDATVETSALYYKAWNIFTLAGKS